MAELKVLFPTKTPVVGALLLALSACTPATFPLQITRLSATPDPVVGKIVTLEVEIQSSEDERDLFLQIRLPDGVRLIDGDLGWQGSLTAEEPFRHRVSVCVLYPGDWEVYVRAYSLYQGATMSVDTDTIHFISTLDTGRAVPGSAYTIVQNTPAPVPSPTPVRTPATCS